VKKLTRAELEALANRLREDLREARRERNALYFAALAYRLADRVDCGLAETHPQARMVAMGWTKAAREELDAILFPNGLKIDTRP